MILAVQCLFAGITFDPVLELYLQNMFMLTDFPKSKRCVSSITLGIRHNMPWVYLMR
jgi:hypothetical protein